MNNLCTQSCSVSPMWSASFLTVTRHMAVVLAYQCSRWEKRNYANSRTDCMKSLASCVSPEGAVSLR